MKKKIKKYFCLSIIFYAISSVTICCIPLIEVNTMGLEKKFSYILGALFWIGLIIGQVMFWISDFTRKNTEEKSESVSFLEWGALSFFRNNESKIADVILIVSVILILILIVFKISNTWLIVLSLAILFMSFNLHCMLNGVNYSYIKNNHKEEGYERNEKN